MIFIILLSKKTMVNGLEKTRKTRRKLEYLIKRAIPQHLINNQELNVILNTKLLSTEHIFK